MCSSVFFLLLQVKLFFDLDIPNMVWRGLKVPAYKKLIIKAFIKKYTFSLSFIEKASRESYLKSHFLLYDNFWEPIEYILHIPIEQFAAYYALNPYDRKTLSCYRNRLLYMLYRIIYKNK